MKSVFQVIGVFHGAERWPYDAPRQGTLAPESRGEVRLHPGCNYEQALQDLSGFSHIWLLFVFHHNQAWKPLVRPPRGDRKVGVFASRAPYRPNPIGMSCVQLVEIAGLTLRVRGHDLLDGTPILDIKPYVPYADAVPEARIGWLAGLAQAEPDWRVTFSDLAAQQLAWLATRGAACIGEFLRQQLAVAPLDASRKRLKALPDGAWEIAYRTWRAEFSVDPPAHGVQVRQLRSGYSPAALDTLADRYADKALHRAFRQAWP